MTTGSLTRTDLNQIHNVVQNTQNNIVKDIIIDVLKDEYSKDSYFRYTKDQYGFAKTIDLTDKPLDIGFDDNDATRIFIGEAYRHDAIFYPAVFVKTGGISYIPISFNRNRETVKYSATKVIDGYGNEKIFTTPTHFVFAGAWEGTINVEVVTRDILARDEIISFCSLMFQDIRHDDFLKAGIAIRKVSQGSPTETYDRQQEPLYKQVLTLDVRNEWRREIPVESVLDAINICVEFGRLDVEPNTVAPNLTINTVIQLMDVIDKL